MRGPLYDVKAPKQTVSLTDNSDLYANIKKLGINASQVAEEALARTLAEQLAEQVRAEIRQDTHAHNAYVDEHGSPAELARAHYGEKE